MRRDKSKLEEIAGVTEIGAGLSLLKIQLSMLQNQIRKKSSIIPDRRDDGFSFILWTVPPRIDLTDYSVNKTAQRTCAI